nr:hypothetical protein Ade03nite_04130 [Actinoplanes derwentensis]
MIPARQYDRRLYRLAAAHPDPRVRRHTAALPCWLDESAHGAPLADPGLDEYAAANPALPVEEMLRTRRARNSGCAGRPVARSPKPRVFSRGDPPGHRVRLDFYTSVAHPSLFRKDAPP